MTAPYFPFRQDPSRSAEANLPGRFNPAVQRPVQQAIGPQRPRIERDPVLRNLLMAFLPGVGEGMDIGNAANAAREGDVGGTLGNLAMAGVGAVPVVGDVARAASKGGKKATGAIGDAARAYRQTWHGTPHVWAPEPGFPHGRPRADRVGTGEGAQAYGWGKIYTAEARETGEAYRKGLSNRDVVVDGKRVGWNDSVANNDLDGRAKNDAIALIQGAGTTGSLTRDELFADARKLAGELKANAMSQGRMNDAMAVDRSLVALGDLEKRGATLNRGALYEIGVPEEDIARMLDWDKPLSEQAPEVSSFIGELGDFISVTDADGVARHYQPKKDARVMTGAGLYDAMSRKYGGKEASLALRAAGIPGIKYLDAWSRNVRPQYRGDMAYVRAAENMRDNRMSVDEARVALRSAYPSRPDFQKLDDAELDAAVDEAYDIQPVQTRNFVIWDTERLKITRALAAMGMISASALADAERQAKAQGVDTDTQDTP